MMVSASIPSFRIRSALLPCSVVPVHSEGREEVAAVSALWSGRNSATLLCLTSSYYFKGH